MVSAGVEVDFARPELSVLALSSRFDGHLYGWDVLESI